MSQPGRKPHRYVLRKLRQEVGFCCPVDGCGSPYLTWHHFDPPWRVEKHHRPEGMIALCRAHADKADNGSFTDDQLRELKLVGKDRAAEVRGRFDWLRRDLLAVVGGNFYYEQPVIFQIGTQPCIWFVRDDQGYLLLNMRMPSLSGRPRARIEDNFWSVDPQVAEVVCPPSGRLVQVEYGNGDRFHAEFSTVASAAELAAKYPDRAVEKWANKCSYPLTIVEISETAAGTNLDFGPHHTSIGGLVMKDCFAARNGGAAVFVGASPEQLAHLFPADDSDGTE